MLKKIILFLVILCFPFHVYAISDSGKSSVVMDISSGRILYSKNKDDKRLIASITKIMTAIVVLENSKLDDIVTVGDDVLKMYGTNIYIEVGEQLSVKDLLYGLLLRSGNDASVVLANYVSGSEKDFVELMNKKAKDIGMKNTIFMNSHGLDDDESKNYSTAYDMALLSRYAYNNSIYKTIISTKKYVTKSNLKSYIWYNRMKLLSNYDFCIGGKNGYTPKAGKTLVSYAKKDDLVLTTVTLNDSDIYNNHSILYDYYFDKYKLYKIIDKNNLNIDKSLFNFDVYVKNSFYYPLSDDEVDLISTQIKVFEEKNNSTIGSLVIYLDNKNIGSVDLYKKRINNVKEKESIFLKIKRFFLKIIKKG